MKTVFDLIRMGYKVPDRKTWNIETRDIFNRLHIPVSGEATVCIEGNSEFRLEVGKAYLLPSHVNMVIDNDDRTVYEHLYIDFRVSPIAVDKKIIEIDLSQDPILMDFKEMLQRRLLEANNGRYYQLDKDQMPRYISHFLQSMLIYIFEKYEVNQLKNEKLAKAMSYIYSNYSENIGNEDIARSVYVHPRQLIRLFKEELNMTPHQCLIEYRVNMAASMLEDDVSIKEICLRCGFDDRNTFRRAFKRIKGIPPSKYNETAKDKKTI